MRQFLEFLTEEISSNGEMITYVDPCVTDHVDLNDELIEIFNLYMKTGINSKNDETDNMINAFLINSISLPWEEIPTTLQATIGEF